MQIGQQWASISRCHYLLQHWHIRYMRRHIHLGWGPFQLPSICQIRRPQRNRILSVAVHPRWCWLMHRTHVMLQICKNHGYEHVHHHDGRLLLRHLCSYHRFLWHLTMIQLLRCLYVANTIAVEPLLCDRETFVSVVFLFMRTETKNSFLVFSRNASFNSRFWSTIGGNMRHTSKPWLILKDMIITMHPFDFLFQLPAILFPITHQDRYPHSLHTPNSNAQISLQSHNHFLSFLHLTFSNRFQMILALWYLLQVYFQLSLCVAHYN